MVVRLFQERKISPKRKFLGQISRGHPGVIRADIPAQNFGSGPSKSWKKNKHLGADIHDPKARTSTTPRDLQKLRSENFGLNFRSLLLVQRDGPKHMKDGVCWAQASSQKVCQRSDVSVQGFFSLSAPPVPVSSVWGATYSVTHELDGSLTVGPSHHLKR